MDISSLPISVWTVSSIVFGLIALSPFIMGFFGKNQFEVKGKTILVTGGSEGLGRSAAIQLAAKGANLIIISRSVEKLEAALADIKAAALNPESQFFHYIPADLAVSGTSAEILTKAKALNNGAAPDIVWCIAGACIPKFFLDIDLAGLRSQMDLNYWAATEMAHAILGDWLKLDPSAKPTGQPRKTHHLIFTSSVLSLYPITGYIPYSPAKAALKSLSDTLAQELLLYQDPYPEVKVHTVVPGTITSPGFERETAMKPDVTLQLEESDPVQSPDEVATYAIQGLEKGQYLVTVAWLGSLMRGLSWGSSPMNNTVWDTLVAFAAIIIRIFVMMDLNGKVRAYGKKHGHPQLYQKGKKAV
ncbi:3-ketodihydrosphingosine reductase-like protein tsc10 [Xylogone sp. PMI_703]|nr:3-ketodihydrosphingosine reductase-like protein tsc10 [Xylogone sp. PMI_703]